MTTTAPPAARTLAALTAHHAHHRPEHPAIRCADRVLTYAQLHHHSGLVARALRAAGLRPGARVAYLGKESEHYYETLFGCARAGAVLVPVNWRLTGPEVHHILEDSGSEVLLVEDALAGVLDRLPTPYRGMVVRLGDGGEYTRWKNGAAVSVPGAPTGETPPAVDGDAAPEPSADPDAPVAQLYTSGTTGLPKGVVLAHRSFFAIKDAMARADVHWIDPRPEDVALVGIPGFHVGGLWWAAQNLDAGATLLVLPAFSPGEAVEGIREHGVTTACVVPAMLRMIANHPGVTPDDFSTLRKVVYGGSPISETLLEESIALLGCEFAQIYGLTETGNTAICLPPEDHLPGRRRPRAAGRPYPGVRVRVIDDSGAPLPTGEVGEVCLATPAHMLEYFNLPERTAETLRDGWIHTGDAGYLDEDGYLHIQDRIKDAVIVAGENVYPAEVEDALESHPGVAEAVVVGTPDERWGEAVHAFVVAAPGERPAPRDLHRHLVGRLASFKLPARYEFIDSVPRNPSGKILRRRLRDPFWAGTDRKVN
ncbi:long-chain-fatty-acid--CoA ligase [Streptomyces spiramenti]|uniref:Long-chain-fatty-acid--CoA ligase n=1 Tax=Streptomyces spiramenti TaxID=2720606 RepID=A0ABX1AKG4_9ACTN|nr:long-chain-fatty-acid--CoA ligase [Streptomyces spiramenti]NJP64745.1 long-chain-fatty-acid--CoA ligase [Streptomyces spiramenti]